MQYDFDVIIVGGGPAGATCALYARQAGLKVLLVDKSTFPRDKICGDSIPGKCHGFLRELGLLEEFERSPTNSIDGVLISSPNEEIARFNVSQSDNKELFGYTCKRYDFDNILFQAAKEQVESEEGFHVNNILFSGGQVYGMRGSRNQNQEKSYTARVVVGADGFKSVVARKVGLWDHDPGHWAVATRGYYRGIEGIGSIFEIHLIDDIIPGYFWIFPLQDGTANVGLGMIHRELKKRNMNLKETHIKATGSPLLEGRFRDAELLGEIRGSNLPLGSKRRTAHGNGFLLLGDAAGLIDPFTGEGIGHAMHSGKIAAEVLADVCGGEDYSDSRLREYEDRVWQEMGDTLGVSYKLQRILRFRFLINLIIKKASGDESISSWIFDMLAGKSSKRAFLRPSAYWRLLTS
ncbi:MAG: NAD(P)/FAD-dependent oxidoreductase [bacterium]